MLVKFDFELDSDQSLALAQFLKRLTLSDIRGCAVDDSESFEMRDALDVLRKAVNEKGFNPR